MEPGTFQLDDFDTKIQVEEFYFDPTAEIESAIDPEDIVK